MMNVLGIDIGGTGIKGAPVDTTTGALLAERHYLKTPQPATPQAVSASVAAIVEHFGWQQLIGCAFPAVVRRGLVLTAANIDRHWQYTNARDRLEQDLGLPVRVLNDADAAGLAEMEYGAGRGRRGVVLVLTLGTGIGTALFNDRQLMPNLELGQIVVRGRRGEELAAASVRERQNLSWEQWASQLDAFLDTICEMLWPELIIIGGGVSKEAERFFSKLSVRTEVLPAQLADDAGIAGAALAATLTDPRKIDQA